LPSPAQNEEKRNVSLGGHVGFDSLPDQLVSKSVTQGFSFNILCVGETGIGKSTLMNTLFNTTFETEEASHYESAVRLRPRTYELQESNVHLKLTIVDAVGFGDQINKDERCRAICSGFWIFLGGEVAAELEKEEEEEEEEQPLLTCCFFFPFFLPQVNIIPIIAKADTISKSELHKFKIKIMSELVSNGVQIYQFPTDDEAVAEINSVMNAHLPFAVVGSTEEVKVGNKLVRARQYPWGVVQGKELPHTPKLPQPGTCSAFPTSVGVGVFQTWKTGARRVCGLLPAQLHEKFEHLKRIHQEEKRKVEEKRRELEEEMNAFNRRKVAVETLQSHSFQATSQQPLKKDKDRKNSVLAGNHSGVCLSSSKVMITKATVEPLSCTSWWQAIQCCSCLVKNATWREGFI
ncbi:SEP8B protein, partial [Oreotrochilus melanogaster]|nr:SEP8B protein [Oreotrochilus melanogaster]